MTDITSKHLDAALIDQSAAGKFPAGTYAFVAVTSKEGWQIGVAVANERGYHPIPKFFQDHCDAKEWADGLNRHMGLDNDLVLDIVGSSMGGRPVVFR